MFLGGKVTTVGVHANTIRLVLFSVCAMLVSAESHEAHAVSSGCLAVRGGALSVTANDLTPDFVGSFDAGETIVWTFTGSTVQQEVIVTPPGAPQPTVTGGTATFTFATTGVFTIAESVSGTVTANCQETTAEKQTAVQAAVKTLTDMQLVQSQAFQGQLLQELANSFLSGVASTSLSREADGVIATLQARQQWLEQQIAAEQQEAARLIAIERRLSASALSVFNNYKAAVARRDAAEIKRAEAATHPGVASYLTLRAEQTGVDRVLAEYEAAIDIARNNYAPYANSRSAEAYRLKQRWEQLYGEASKIRRSMELKWLRFSLTRRDPGPLGNLRGAEQIIGDANNQIAGWQTAYNAALVSLPVSEARIANIQSQTEARIAPFVAESASIRAEIARITSQIGTVQGRIDSSLSPYMGTSQQSGFDFASRYAPAYGNNPFKVSYSGEENVSIFTDLNSILGHQDGNRQQRQNPTFNIWAKGNFSKSESDQDGADRDGTAYAFATGAYYVPTQRVMLGAMYRFRYAESQSVAQSSDIGTSGHGVGVYSTFVITPKLSFSAQALYERSNNDIIRSGATGSYDADQYVASGTLQGMFSVGPLWVRPAVGVTFARVDSQAFTDSAGTPNAAQTTTQGQLTFGPSLGYRKQMATGAIKSFEPSLVVTGLWNFKNEGDTTLASGSIIEQDTLSLQSSAGLSLLFRNDASLSLNAGYSGLGASEMESYSFGGRVNIPLSGN